MSYDEGNLPKCPHCDHPFHFQRSYDNFQPCKKCGKDANSLKKVETQ